MKRSEGDGLPRRKPDRTGRILNYPGLEYYDGKLRKRFAQLESERVTDPEVDEILASWAEGQDPAIHSAGVMAFSIDSAGHLIYQRENVEAIDFELSAGRLVALWE